MTVIYPGQIDVVVGGQFGSEGKGAVAHKLTSEATLPIRVAGPNAGHTAYDDTGRAWKLRQVPVSAIANGSAPVVIGAGSEVDPSVLESEVSSLEEAGFNIRGRLIVDAQATVITPAHLEAESSLVGRVGSTGKGIGAARAARIMRTARTVGQTASDFEGICEVLGDTVPLIEEWADQGGHILIEGTQGYGLGLHAGYYPYSTSSDCRAIDFLAMAGVVPWAPVYGHLRIWVVARTYPIRVAGNSGPLASETTWEALGLPEEYTTVTNKVRRVGHFDHQSLRAAVEANGRKNVLLALTMVDQMFPETAGKNPSQFPDEVWDWLEGVEETVGARISMIGTGPTSYFSRPFVSQMRGE